MVTCITLYICKIQSAKCNKNLCRYNNITTMLNITEHYKCSQEAIVKNFKVRQWDKVKRDIMLQLLRSKFAPGSELAAKLTATSCKSLAESHQSPSL